MIASATTFVLLTSVLLSPAASANVTKTKGTGHNFFTSWTEYDPKDDLGLPGNTHVGYFGSWSSQWGTYFYGAVEDWDCKPGQVPGGGHGGGEVIVDDAAKIAELAGQLAVDKIIDSGAKTLDADTVIDAIKDELAEEVPKVVDEVIGKFCKPMGTRFLDGVDENGKVTATVTVDAKNKKAKVTGNLIVRGGHGGGHGEEAGPVLGRPPIELTISGGDWYNYDSSYKTESKDFKYSDWYKGTDYYGGTVSGRIGGMGFDDDPDDESYGGFGTFQFKTVERVRN